MSADLRRVVGHNLDVARRVLLVSELKKRSDDIPSILPLLDGIRGFLRRGADEVKDASLPLILVFVASCLEHYLREKIHVEKLGLKSLIVRFHPSIGDNLARDAHEIRIKRDVILRNAGTIDEQASKEFEEIGLTGYPAGAKLVLSEDEVRRYIDVCEKICNLI